MNFQGNGFKSILRKIVGEPSVPVLDVPTASVLRERVEIDNASRLVADLGQSSHHDAQKDWDTVAALSGILKSGNKSPKVWDAGSGAKPVILRWLRDLLPESSLYACDRVKKSPEVFKKLDIEFSIQDMSATDYPDAFFDYVTSISVIEHGVDVESFFKEVARVLKPGGMFYVSTDYWEEKLDTSHKFPYEKKYGPMIVFDKTEIAAFVKSAESFGLKLHGDWASCHVKDKVIYWERMDERYTYAFLPFEKVA